MAWTNRFDDPTREGLVLVPSGAALVQDLGPSRSGRAMETDILPRSALICAGKDGKPVLGENGKVRFAFEGNAVEAVNLRRFHERCTCAAGRLATRAPSIAYGEARLEDLKVVAGFDLLRYVFTRVIDAPALEAWSGEEIASYLPPAQMVTPTSDPAVTGPLCDLPMRSLAGGSKGAFVWTLLDGTILTMTKGKDGNGPLTAWRIGDPGLLKILEAAGLEAGLRMLLS